jgi:anaerobic ribonucleoside-triphosphate reductase activating protein
MNCVASDWIPFKKGLVIEVVDLAEAIIAKKEIDGITLSGGEPMMQAGRLAMLLRLVKEQKPDLNVIVFSGFTKAQLVWDEAEDLLNQCDLLIDGQYVEHLNNGNGLKGSSNQEFHFLTDRLLSFKEEIIRKRTNVEIHLLDDGALLTGIPSPNFNW